MPYATNPVDATRIYFEDTGGSGIPVVLHGGLLDCVDDVRESAIARGLPSSEFRAVYVDHRGLGRSDKPHDPAAYAMPVRARDPAAVLDELGIDRAHFVGMSWGGRLGFGIGAHTPDRVRALVCSGQQPYAWPDSPLTRAVTRGLDDSRHDALALVEAFERFWQVRFPEAQRARWIDNDPRALQAMWTHVLAEGPVASDLTDWTVPCLIVMGSGDVDFLDQARRAAAEIPRAELLLLDEADHYAAHVSADDALIEAVLRTCRAA
jgi:pimeloyl-ACP methyl ester carboxylesterase